ncbi:MAG: HAD-IB family phosphatase, partial [Vallitaleaceae bacterium]|nr:HAD-IB family phosphatase [Vallitaleaceae bacterium]
ITISGSPIELVREMSIKHGFDAYIGSIYELDANSCYTGGVIPMWDSKSKKAAIDSLIEKYDIDLSSSYAYGDTAGDFMMLRLVGNPYAMNPTRELLSKICHDDELKEKIHVVVERKDMIYQLTPSQLDLNI